MKPVLLLIDIQKAFEHPSWGSRNNPDAEEKAAKLLAHWREIGAPVVHVQHTSTRTEGSLFFKGSYGHEFKEGLEPLPGERVFQKRVNSAFIGTGLKDYLDEHDVSTLVICGLTTPHCVSTSTRMAGNYGYNVYLVEDATAAFERKGWNGGHYSAQEVHDVELSLLEEEFAKVIRTEEALKIIGY